LYNFEGLYAESFAYIFTVCAEGLESILLTYLVWALHVPFLDGVDYWLELGC
jgi:hypothetical protein